MNASGSLFVQINHSQSQVFSPKPKTITHECNLNDFKYDMHGAAITDCWEDDDGLWVANGEYATKVNFCPACGYKAKEKL